MHLCTGRVGGAFYIWFLINFLIYLCKKKKFEVGRQILDSVLIVNICLDNSKVRFQCLNCTPELLSGQLLWCKASTISLYCWFYRRSSFIWYLTFFFLVFFFFFENPVWHITYILKLYSWIVVKSFHWCKFCYLS